MPDYAAMYKRLFNSQTTAIEILQQAQQDTENMYYRSAGTDANGSGAQRAGQGRIKKGGSMAATNGFHALIVFVGELLNIDVTVHSLT